MKSVFLPAALKFDCDVTHEYIVKFLQSKSLFCASATRGLIMAFF